MEKYRSLVRKTIKGLTLEEISYLIDFQERNRGPVRRCEMNHDFYVEGVGSDETICIAHRVGEGYIRKHRIRSLTIEPFGDGDFKNLEFIDSSEY